MALETYGMTGIPATATQLHIELLAFREDSANYGIDPERRPFHFKNIVRTLFPKGCRKPYQWDPWTDKMLISACREKVLAMSGCASSRKTCFGAMWALINWLAWPGNTLVLVTSTTMEDARRRIWGEIEGLFNSANETMNSIVKGARLPGKVLGSTCKLRTEQEGMKFDDKCGIQLIAGDRTKEKENIGRLVGLKNKRVILIADELPELSPALFEASMSNLMTNPFFQVIGLGNFASIYDAFGQFSEPLDGWASVSPDVDEWRTRNGLCLRFDGLKSPNILCGENRYHGQYGSEHLKNHRETFGENTAIFWRMCRSFPCPEADTNRIYSDADLVKGNAKGTVKWLDIPTKVASLDPAFATGGDAAVATIGLLGLSSERVWTLQITKQVELREDVRLKDQSRSTQVCRGFIALCAAEGVKPEHRAVDISGGGLPFGALLSELSDNKFLGVQFGGAPSLRAASSKDRRPAKDAFSNRVAELWYAGVDFIQGGQIKGLTNAICVELTERRKLDPIKGSGGIKLRIESKKEMKLRTGGKSCDFADSFIVALELCRERLGFSATGMEAKRNRPQNDFKAKVRAINRIYQNVNYEPEEVAA